MQKSIELKDKAIVVIKQSKIKKRLLAQPAIVHKRLEYEEKVKRPELERSLRAFEISNKIQEREERIESMQ